MTPLMRQYWDVKNLHPDKILLFRMGDFYEMFHDDAVKAAPIIGIALTARNKKSQEETPMCGVPYHSIAGPINKLLAAGLKVAICEQVEDPKLAKGLVKREVTRCLTPGMVYDPETLDFRKPNYIAAKTEDSLSCVDTSTGEAFTYKNLTVDEVARLIQLLPIAEMLDASISDANTAESSKIVGESSATERAILTYIGSLSNPESLSHVQKFEERSLKQKMYLSPVTLKHLEVFETYSGKLEGSFFHAIDRTVTAAGARLLRSKLAFPYMDIQSIQSQQSSTRAWIENATQLKNFRALLAKVGDIERRISKIVSPQNSGRDLLSLADSIEAGIHSLQHVPSTQRAKLNDKPLAVAQTIQQKIRSTLLEEQPVSIRGGRVIRLGVSMQLDEYVNLAQNSQSLILEMEAKERELTGIGSLKIRYNSVFGYYIEVTNSHSAKVPAHYQRKQTLVNAERFCTPDLLELEKKVLSAESKRESLEVEIYNELRSEILAHVDSILQFAAVGSQLDLDSSLAWLALERNYVFPEFNKTLLKLTASRHPVVEQISKSRFVANDLTLDNSEGALLTGPNMAGKSTLMRQVALIAILAQIGAPVPAKAAVLPIYDQISTRIGASDQLTEGLSTFMVEMKETAEILKRSTTRSLLILDEIGRGTSTYDGMSLAQAILEHIATELKSQFLFATHYHELSGLSQKFSNVHNFHMKIAEKSGQIEFLYSLKSGPAGKSYGLHVAELAGLPAKLLARARSVLADLEAGKSHIPNEGSNSGSKVSHPQQLNFMEMSRPVDARLLFLEKALRDFDVSNETPIRALLQIENWKKSLDSNWPSDSSDKLL